VREGIEEAWRGVRRRRDRRIKGALPPASQQDARHVQGSPFLASSLVAASHDAAGL